MYIMCVCLFSTLSRRVGELQIFFIIIIIIIISSSSSSSSSSSRQLNIG